MGYINDDFLLTTKAARELYHGYAEKMPIIDYHCHLPPAEIAEDKRWEDIAQVLLGGDHYKWRQMRSNGVDERYVTGNASWHDKFVILTPVFSGFPGGSDCKESACNAGDLGWEDALKEEGIPSCP